MDKDKKRLSKTLAAGGIASRRACETLIFEGRVKVNGQVVKTPQTLVDINTDTIEVNGERVLGVEEKVYYMLNKPIGYVCSGKKIGQDKIVLELFEGEGHRLFTIGRLDKDTMGLLLLTNDGAFAQRVIHPSANISKEYLVKTNQEVSHEHLLAISQGTSVEGVFVKPLKVTKVRRGTLKVTIAEGKKREVRVLLEAAGLDVIELTRIRLGGLTLGALPVGSWRPLSEREQRAIFEGVEE